MKRSNQQHRGFTIIELVVVLGIIGLLAATIGPKAVAFFGSGKVTAAKEIVLGTYAGAQRWKPRNGNMTGVSMTALQDNGLIPDSYGDGTGINPWSGNVTITHNTSDVTQVIITVTNITEDDQGNLLVRELGDNAANGTTPTYATGTFTITMSGQ